MEFTGLVVKRRVFVPVSNLGNASTFGSGISKQATKFPKVSDINLESVTVASAPLVSPLRVIFLLINHWNVPRTSCCNDPVSTFKTELVAE